MGGFFKVPADNRDLNYDKYTVKGGHEVEEVEPYTSHNTARLTVPEMKKLLQKLSLFGGTCRC
jgi:UDP-glucose 4-epimerase